MMAPIQINDDDLTAWLTQQFIRDYEDADAEGKRDYRKSLNSSVAMKESHYTVGHLQDWNSSPHCFLEYNIPNKNDRATFICDSYASCYDAY